MGFLVSMPVFLGYGYGKRPPITESSIRRIFPKSLPDMIYDKCYSRINCLIRHRLFQPMGHRPQVGTTDHYSHDQENPFGHDDKRLFGNGHGQPHNRINRFRISDRVERKTFSGPLLSELIFWDVRTCPEQACISPAKSFDALASSWSASMPISSLMA